MPLHTPPILLSMLSLVACTGLFSPESPPAPQADPSQPAAQTPPSPTPAAARARETRTTPEQVSLDGTHPVETLRLNQALWGVDVPNALKGVYVAYDPVSDVVFHTAITSRWLVATRPAAGHPDFAVDLEIERLWNVAFLEIDPARRRLFWISRNTQEVRVIDLDTLEIVGRYDGVAGSQGYPVTTCALDPGTGWMWVFNRTSGALTGYPPDGGATRTLSGVDAMRMVADPAGERLYVIDVVDRSSARLLALTPSTGATEPLYALPGRKPPTSMALDSQGNLILGQRGVQSVSPSGQLRWSTPLWDDPQDVLVHGGVIAVLMAEGQGSREEAAPGQVLLLDEASGTQRAAIAVGYEAKSMTLDPKTGQLFVGNGGDGSISVVTLASGTEARRLEVSHSAEALSLDPKTGNRFVLSRLGGSAVYAWPAGSSTLTRVAQLPWPFAMAADEARRRLIVASHFRAALSLYDLDSLQPVREIPLGSPANSGDALGDFDYDAESQLAAVLFPQEGWLAVVDVAQGKVRWSTQIPGMKANQDGGPGAGFVEVGGGHVYVASPLSGEIRLYDASSGDLLRQAALPGASAAQTRPDPRAGSDDPRPEKGGKGGKSGKAGKGGKGGKADMPDERPPRDGAGGRPQGDTPPARGGGGGGAGGRSERASTPRLSEYSLDILFLDQAGKRLFLGGLILDAATLEVVQDTALERVFYADAARILGMIADKSSEVVVELDAQSLAERTRLSLQRGQGVHADSLYDPRTGQVYLADMPTAEVTVWGGFQ